MFPVNRTRATRTKIDMNGQPVDSYSRRVSRVSSDWKRGVSIVALLSPYRKLRESITATHWPTASPVTTNQSWTICLYQCSRASSCWHGLLALNEVRVIHAFLRTESKFRGFGSKGPVGEERKANAKFLVNWESWGWIKRESRGKRLRLSL